MSLRGNEWLRQAHAVALFPGGFGTHDEGFETLTLLQTGKTPPMPLVLMELPEEDYWESWDHFIRTQLLSRQLISPADLSLYRIVHSANEAVDWIREFYTYHSMRQVQDTLVPSLPLETPWCFGRSETEARFGGIRPGENQRKGDRGHKS